MQTTAPMMSAPTMGPTSVDKASDVPSHAEWLAETVETVCKAIMVSSFTENGKGTISIQLKPEVLDGSNIQLVVENNELSIVLQPTTTDVQSIFEKNIAQFEEHLAGRIHNYQISVSIRKGKDNERV